MQIVLPIIPENRPLLLKGAGMDGRTKIDDIMSMTTVQWTIFFILHIQMLIEEQFL